MDVDMDAEIVENADAPKKRRTLKVLGVKDVEKTKEFRRIKDAKIA